MRVQLTAGGDFRHIIWCGNNGGKQGCHGHCGRGGCKSRCFVFVVVVVCRLTELWSVVVVIVVVVVVVVVAVIVVVIIVVVVAVVVVLNVVNCGLPLETDVCIDTLMICRPMCHLQHHQQQQQQQ